MNDMTKNELIVEGCRSMAFQDLRDTLSAALDDRDATIAALRAEVERLKAVETILDPKRAADIAAVVKNCRELGWSDSLLAAALNRVTDANAELTQLREDRWVLATEATLARNLFEAAEREACEDRSMQTQQEYDRAYTAYMAVRKDTDASKALERAT